MTIDPANPLLGPEEPELTCEECFEQLDAYVEYVLAEQRADQRVPGMRAHLAGCPACREDFESLLEFTRRQDSPG
jgi:hypothetical protein